MKAGLAKKKGKKNRKVGRMRIWCAAYASNALRQKNKAKNIIKTAIIGLVIVIVSYALVNEFIALGS